MKKSKNDAKNRGKSVDSKLYNGKAVKPAFYNGARIGHGNYVAAQYEDGKLAFDDNGKPVPFHSITTSPFNAAGEN